MKIERSGIKSQGGAGKKKGASRPENKESFLEALLESQSGPEVEAAGSTGSADQDIKNLAAMIDQFGEDLVENPTPENFVRYKSHIKSFISIVKENYEIRTVTSRKGFTSQKIYYTIENLQESLDELAQMVMSREKKRVSYLKLVDNIKGLIIDLTM